MLRKLLLAFILFPSSVFAQDFAGTLVFSADNGDAFFVYLNGKKQNAGAQSNVTIHGLELPYYDVRIEFLNSSVKPLEKKNISVADSDDRPMMVTYKIRKDKSGKARLSFYAMLPPVSTKTLQVAQVSEKTENETINKKPASPNSKTLLTNVSGATVSIPANDSLTEKKEKINIQQSGVGVNKPVPVVKAEPKKVEVTTPATPVNKTEPVVSSDSKKVAGAPVKADTPTELPLKKCNDWPMMKEEFQKIKQQVEEAKDEPSRLAKSKTLSSANCLLVSQVSEIAVLFAKETTRLNFVKHAYLSTIDRPNFDRLKKLFTEPAAAKEFEKFLQARK